MDIDQKLDTPLGRRVRFSNWSADTIIAQQKQQTVAPNVQAVSDSCARLFLEFSSRATSET